MPTGFAVTYFAYGGTFPLTSQPFRNATSSSAQVQVGACRDSTGHFSSPRIECPAGKTHFSELVTRCVALGARCDAVDIDSEPVAPGHDPVVSWCVCVCVCVCARARACLNLSLFSPSPPLLPLFLSLRGAVWGLNITAADATAGWTFYCDEGCNATGATKVSVCKGDESGGGNTCYHRLRC